MIETINNHNKKRQAFQTVSTTRPAKRWNHFPPPSLGGLRPAQVDHHAQSAQQRRDEVQVPVGQEQAVSRQEHHAERALQEVLMDYYLRWAVFGKVCVGELVMKALIVFPV